MSFDSMNAVLVSSHVQTTGASCITGGIRRVTFLWLTRFAPYAPLKGGERIEPSVGYSEIVELGEKVVKGQPLARLHARSERSAQAAEKAFLESVTIGESANLGPLIVAKVG